MRGIPDAGSRVAVSALFALLTISLVRDFVQTSHVTGLLLIASESLVVVLTVVRRYAPLVDRTAAARLVTAASLAGPMLLRPYGTALISDALTTSVTAAGVALVVFGKAALGRSFGLAPANRGVVVRGPYRIVRHPIYAGYLVVHVGFLLAHPAWQNVALAVASDAALIIRAFMEERVLQTDAAYRSYCARVAWHLVPGVF
jgi:protein-S-isoprenylcysteine O-methyltransferase Ste14